MLERIAKALEQKDKDAGLTTCLKPGGEKCHNSRTDPFRVSSMAQRCEPVIGNKRTGVMGYTF
jgi:hypothetical protein